MHRFILILLLLAVTQAATAQNTPQGFDIANYGVRIEPDRRLMVVMAALEIASIKNAAGVEEKLINTPLTGQGIAFRQHLLTDAAGTPVDLRERISAFVAHYRKRHPGVADADIVAPFISMAYTLSPVPELANPRKTDDLPGSLLEVLDFAPLVREFYRRSAIKTRLELYVKEYKTDVDVILRTSARDMVSELLTYLHTSPQLIFTETIRVDAKKGNSKKVLQNIETRDHERRFFIVPEKLAAKNNVNFLNIRDDYYIIVPPDADLRFSEARRAFLQFVLDPVVMRNAKEIAPIQEWAKPLLDEKLKSNPNIVLLSVLRSLVAAVDIRQTEYSQIKFATSQAIQKIDRLASDDEKRAVSAALKKIKGELSDETVLKLYEEYEKGNVLSLYFAEQLKGMEDSGFDIAASMREMISGFDAVKETNRVAQSAEARGRALALRESRKQNPAVRTGLAVNPVTTRLEEIETTIKAGNYAKAASELKILSKENSSEARIYFNIGRVASLEARSIEDSDARSQKLLEAKNAYTDVLKFAGKTNEKALISLTYVELAKIYEFHNENATALNLYDMAIRIGEVTGGAHSEAIARKQRLLKPQ